MTTSMLCSTSSTVLPSRWSAQDVVLHLVDHRGIHGGGRLVEQEQLGVGHQRAGEGQELALPVGEAAGRQRRPSPPRPTRSSSRRARSTAAASSRRSARRAQQPRQQLLLLVLLEEHQQVLERAEAGEDADLLERARHAEPRHAVGRRAGEVVAAEEHAPAVGGEIAGDAVEERGLARAVRADQAHQLAAARRPGPPGPPPSRRGSA